MPQSSVSVVGATGQGIMMRDMHSVRAVAETSVARADRIPHAPHLVHSAANPFARSM